MIVNSNFFERKIEEYRQTEMFMILNSKEKHYYLNNYIFLLLIDIVKSNTSLNIEDLNISAYLTKVYDQILDCRIKNKDFIIKISDDDIVFEVVD